MGGLIELIVMMAGGLIATVTLGGFLQRGIKQVRAELKEVKTELKADIKEVKTELKTELKEVKDDLADVRIEIADIRTDAAKMQGQTNERLARIEERVGIGRAEAGTEPAPEPEKRGARRSRARKGGSRGRSVAPPPPSSSPPT